VTRVSTSRAVASGVLAALACACVREGRVERAFDGQVVEGRFIDPRAYAAFLRGTIAEANADNGEALAGFEEAARTDPDSAEIWTRIGDVRCRADAHDGHADAGFSRALAIDATYARAWAAKARCAIARGDTAGARAAAGRAAALDSTADAASVLLARTAPSPGNAVTRDALVALTVTARDPPVAWDALASWAQANGDVALWARALAELVRVAPGRRDEVARAAEQLAGAGEIAQARRVALAVANSDPRPLADHPLAAGLALDEAIARGDLAAVSQCATRVRAPLDEAAGRALLAWKRSLAHDLASSVARADPTALGAHLLLAASGGGDLLGALHDAGAGSAETSAAAFIAFGVALAHATSPEHARAALATIAHRPILAGDDRVVRPAVDLASRGLLPVEALPPDGVVELAALRGEALPEKLLGEATRSLDARHEYLALAISRRDGARARELAWRLRGAVADPVVAAASAFAQLASGAPIAAGAPQALLARDAGDPLLAVATLRLAERVGDHDVARRAREALTAFGGGAPANVE